MFRDDKQLKDHKASAVPTVTPRYLDVIKPIETLISDESGQSLLSYLRQLQALYDQSSEECQAINEEIKTVLQRFNEASENVKKYLLELNKLLDGNVNQVKDLYQLQKLYAEENGLSEEKLAIKEAIENIKNVIVLINDELKKLAKLQQEYLLSENNVKIFNTRMDKALQALVQLCPELAPRICPINTIDPMTQEPIPEENAIYMEDRHQFDIVTLVQWINAKKDFLNPLNRKKFSPNDIENIKEFAKLKNLVIDARIVPKKPVDPNDLDLRAIELAQIRPWSVVPPGIARMNAAHNRFDREPAMFPRVLDEKPYYWPHRQRDRQFADIDYGLFRPVRRRPSPRAIDLDREVVFDEKPLAPNNNRYDYAPLVAAISEYDNNPSEQNLLRLGALQRQMPVHVIQEIMFHTSQGRSLPDVIAMLLAQQMNEARQVNNRLRMGNGGGGGE